MARYGIFNWGGNTQTPETNLDVFKHDSICGNNGNLLFKNAVAKTLYIEKNMIEYLHFYNQSCPNVANAYSHNNIDAINERFDALILSEADLFNRSYKERFPYFTAALRKIKIPVIMIGVGMASSLGKEILVSSSIDSDVKKFVAALLDHSASIGVRGHCTGQYLRRLGFSSEQIDVIGCPTMFTNGKHLVLKGKIGTENEFRQSFVTFNGTLNKPNAARLLSSHDNHAFLPQDSFELFSALFEDISDKSIFHNMLYHPALRPEKVRFFTNVPQWRKCVGSAAFSFGSRVHGNLIALISGTPAYVLVTDARTEELVQYHEIPYTYAIPDDASLYDIYAGADYTNTLRGHAARFARYRAFLDKNNLYHCYMDEDSRNDAFEQVFDEDAFPGHVAPVQCVSEREIKARMIYFMKDLENSRQPGVLASLSRERKAAILKKMESLLQ